MTPAPRAPDLVYRKAAMSLAGGAFSPFMGMSPPGALCPRGLSNAWWVVDTETGRVVAGWWASQCRWEDAGCLGVRPAGERVSGARRAGDADAIPGVSQEGEGCQGWSTPDGNGSMLCITFLNLDVL